MLTRMHASKQASKHTLHMRSSYHHTFTSDFKLCMHRKIELCVCMFTLFGMWVCPWIRAHDTLFFWFADQFIGFRFILFCLFGRDSTNKWHQHQQKQKKQSITTASKLFTHINGGNCLVYVCICVCARQLWLYFFFFHCILERKLLFYIMQCIEWCVTERSTYASVCLWQSRPRANTFVHTLCDRNYIIL